MDVVLDVVEAAEGGWSQQANSVVALARDDDLEVLANGDGSIDYHEFASIMK
ncbi:hypothetical protein C8A05DRAFT_40087 [Staphylotrichum tortipilum]|uniref:EF-hand domain-containing protein n=1 Tax=Staphylotrichum tortipilum TaxID=2831512 RepID=A0AAN6M9G2_9PEZI|nr:hypothetical protein C8A05DRAFT_40087 [Staphylotrichum longicolle]